MEKQSISRHQIAYMFNRIASRYDQINRILSFGLDRSWRKKVGRFLPLGSNLTVVDIATGTADQIFSLKNRKEISQFIGFDISEKMLQIGLEKIKKGHFTQKISLQLGSGLNIPLKSAASEVATLSFGIRNMTDPFLALKELHRILKPEGRALVLEFTLPENLFMKKCARLYLRYVLPVVGRILSKDQEAYSYLHTSIEEFSKKYPISILMKDAGFRNAFVKRFCFGIVSLFVGEK